MLRKQISRPIVLTLMFAFIFLMQTAKTTPSSKDDKIDFYETAKITYAISLKSDISKYRLTQRDKQSNAIDFLSVDYIYQVIVNSNVKPSIVLSQSAIETYWGSRPIGYNYFGIKGGGHIQRTVEYINGHRLIRNESFKSYKSITESISHHSSILNMYYQILDTTCLSKAIPKLSRYATDPTYTYKVAAIIKQYDLEAIDELKDDYRYLLNIIKR